MVAWVLGSFPLYVEIARIGRIAADAFFDRRIQGPVRCLPKAARELDRHGFELTSSSCVTECRLDFLDCKRNNPGGQGLAICWTEFQFCLSAC